MGTPAGWSRARRRRCWHLARSLGFVSEAVAWVFGRISGGHRHATHSFLGIAVLAWVSCHFRADWGGKAGLALLMTLSVSAALEALHLALLIIDPILSGALLALAVWIIDPAWLRGQWGPLAG